MADHNDPVVKDIIKARVKLLLEKPFFGNMATRLELVDASKWCKTAATDGRRLFYNREFIKGLTQPELLFLVGHEVLHNVFEHMLRKGDRDPKIWNMAADYVINYILTKEQVGKMPAGGLYDQQYTDDMAAEEVYEKLKSKSVTIKMPLDEHIDPSKKPEPGKGKSGGQGGEVEVTVMGTDGPPTLSEDELAEIRNEIRTATMQAAQAVGAGKVPMGVKRLLDALSSPKMDWRAMLDATIRSAVKSDYTFQRPSRRSWSVGAILPGPFFQDTIDVAVAIDASGSMSTEQLRDIAAEVKGIMQTFEDFKLHLWTFDTGVYNYKYFTGENIGEIDEYVLQGGGGTSFECNWEFMKENDIMPHRFVMFTDGYPGSSWGDEEYVDTLFVIHGTTSIVAPFGQTAYYTFKNER